MNLEQHYTDIHRMAERAARLIDTVQGVAKGIADAGADVQDSEVVRLANGLRKAVVETSQWGVALVKWAQQREAEVKGRTA